MQRRAASLIGALGLLVLSRPASAGPNPAVPCIPPGATRFVQFDALPAPIRLDVLHRFAPDAPENRLAGLAGALVARPGADWQVTDVVMPGRNLPGRRFIVGAQSGPRLWVWYESGGVAHLTHVALYSRGDGRWTLARHLSAGAPATLCKRLASGPSLDERFW